MQKARLKIAQAAVMILSSSHEDRITRSWKQHSSIKEENVDCFNALMLYVYKTYVSFILVVDVWVEMG